MDYPELKLTEEDLKEIDESIKRNDEERMEFVKKYAEWLKKTSNKVWSKQQNKSSNNLPQQNKQSCDHKRKDKVTIAASTKQQQ